MLFSTRQLSFACIIFIQTVKVMGQPYAVGDTIPEIRLQHLFNFRSETCRLSDFKNKLLILDFWDVSCIACIESFSKLDSLQKKFKDSLQILLVNRQSEDSTKRFFEKRRKIKIPGTPFITEDSILQTWFPHKGEPFHVWIDKDRIVRYIVSGYNTTSERVDSFLEGRFPVMEDYETSDYTPSLINAKWASKVLYNSCISLCIEGTHLEAPGHSEGFTRITKNCSSVVELFIYAYNEGNWYKYNRPGCLIMNIKDSEEYFRPSNTNRYDEWEKKYSYDYQLVLPQSSDANPYQVMQDDLSRYFGIEAAIEYRNIPSIVLVPLNTGCKLGTSRKLKVDKFYKASLINTSIDSLRYMTNQPFEHFISKLRLIMENSFGRVFLDSVGYDGNIDITIHGEVLDNNDYKGIRKDLNEYGLDLVKKNCYIPVLVLKKKREDLMESSPH